MYATGAIIAIMSTLTGSGNAAQPRPAPEIVLCGDLVPPEIRQAHATFTIIYELTADDSGQVVGVKKLINDLLPDSAVVACLTRWRLPPSTASARVLLHWKHAAGWTLLAIGLPGHTVRRMTIDPGWPW